MPTRNVVGLDHLMPRGRPPTDVVARRAETPLHWAAFGARVAAWSEAFCSRPERRWGFFFSDTAEFAAALLGAWHADVCVHLLADTVPGTLAAAGREVDGFVGDVPAELAPLQPAPAGAASCRRWGPLSRDSTVLVVYTSGSTGKPTAIPKRLGQLLAEVETLESLWGGLLHDATVVSTVSHQHIYGLLFRVLWPLAAGRPFAAASLAYPEQVLAALRETQCAVVTSPAHLKRLPCHLPWPEVHVSVRAVFSSGGPLPDDALPRCRAAFGQVPIEVFGSSETGGLAYRQRLDDVAEPWRPLPAVHWRVDGETLLVRSPHLAAPGWYRTEDRVEATATGFVLLGRRDRVAKIEEKRVSLPALEQTLADSRLVSEVRVVPLAGGRTTLGVVAVPSDGGWDLHDRCGKRALNRALRTAAAHRLEPAVLPRRFAYVEALPINTQGKVTEAALAALFPSGESQRGVERTSERTAPGTGPGALPKSTEAGGPVYSALGAAGGRPGVDAERHRPAWSITREIT